MSDVYEQVTTTIKESAAKLDALRRAESTAKQFADKLNSKLSFYTGRVADAERVLAEVTAARDVHQSKIAEADAALNAATAARQEHEKAYNSLVAQVREIAKPLAARVATPPAVEE